MDEKIEVDKTLTPENASVRNLVWIKDVIFDREAPDEAMTDVIEIVKNGGVLGMPAGSNSENNACGLYRKLGLT